MAEHVTAEQFEATVLTSDIPVIIDFYAEWCGPCKQMAPHFDKLASELAGQYKLVKVNIDNERDLAIKHAIASIPTLVFYKNGSVVGTATGYLDEADIKNKITELF